MGAAQNQGTVVDLDLQHPYLSNCRTRTTADSTEMLAAVPSQLTTYRLWKESLDSLASSPHTAFLLLPLQHKFDEGGVCSTSGELTLTYPHFPRILSSEIALRKKEAKRFTEGELWYLLYALAMAKSALSEICENVGDIQPRNIFLNETGEIKVASLRSWPGQVSNYRRAVLEQQCGYLAPEDIERLKLGAMDNQINTESQMFAMGLVMMACAGLQLQQDLYEMRENEFQEDLFFSRLGRLQHDATYSEILRGVVSNLLEIEPLKRMSLLELKGLLEKHSENIVAKKPLRIDNAPKKLQRTVNEMFRIIRPADSDKPVAPKPPPAQTSQKILNFINFEDKKPSSQNSLPAVSSKSELTIENAQKAPIFVNNYAAEEPHRPAISKVYAATVSPVIKKTESVPFDSPPKYKPFEAIANNLPSPAKPEDSKPAATLDIVPKQAEPKPRLIEESKVREVVVERPVNTQIWLGEETSIRQLNIFMDSRREGFDHNSLINTKYEPENVSGLQSESSLAERPRESVVKEAAEEEEVSEEKPAAGSQLERNDESPIDNSLLKSSEVSEKQKGSEQPILEEHDLPLKEERPQEHVVVEEEKKEAKIASVEIATSNSPFAPTVKLWGMKPAATAKDSANSTNVREIASPADKIPEQPAVSVDEAEPAKEANYILIEQDSKHAEQSHQEHHQPQQQESQLVQYHTYADIATEGSYQQCWQAILSFLKDPTDFSKLIKPDKVKIRILEDRWSLKVGPGIFDILLNKEEGKFLLRNCEQSQCEGEMLGGVFKDEQKRHRLWFNSAYYYKGRPVPSRLVVEECLQSCLAAMAPPK